MVLEASLSSEIKILSASKYNASLFTRRHAWCYAVMYVLQQRSSAAVTSRGMFPCVSTIAIFVIATCNVQSTRSRTLPFFRVSFPAMLSRNSANERSLRVARARASRQTHEIATVYWQSLKVKSDWRACDDYMFLVLCRFVRVSDPATQSVSENRADAQQIKHQEPAQAQAFTSLLGFMTL